MTWDITQGSLADTEDSSRRHVPSSRSINTTKSPNFCGLVLCRMRTAEFSASVLAARKQQSLSRPTRHVPHFLSAQTGWGARSLVSNVSGGGGGGGVRSRGVKRTMHPHHKGPNVLQTISMCVKWSLSPPRCPHIVRRYFTFVAELMLHQVPTTRCSKPSFSPHTNVQWMKYSYSS